MKITDHPDGTLVVEDRPWLLGLFLVACAIGSLIVIRDGVFGDEGWPVALVGVLLLTGSLAAFRLAVRRVRLTLSPARGTARLDVRDRAGHRREEWPLTSLKPAIVEVRRDDGETYRLALCFTDRRPLPFTAYYSGGVGPERAKDRINLWLERHAA